MQPRTEYKIDHQYTVLKISVLICALKLFTTVMARSSFGREFQSLGAATIKAVSPNVVFDRTAGIESKILPEDLSLYKDNSNVGKSHRYFRSKAVNCSILNCMIMRPPETGTTRASLQRKVPNTPTFWKRILCICCGSILPLVLILFPSRFLPNPFQRAF